MKDWVITYLKKKNTGISEVLLKEIKRLDFNVYDELDDIFFGERHQKYDAYLDAMVALIDHFNCHFEPMTQFKCSNCQKFTWMFVSVVASLSKDQFNALSGAKNTFYVYSPANNAYTKDFEINKMKIPMDEQADIKVVVFHHEVATFPWLLGRFCILRELAKIILSSRDEDYLNGKMKAWGFEKEVNHAMEFESTRRDAISTFYAL